MTFYLKYRPKNLDELDLSDVGESLKKIVSSKDIPHAFLFAGPKGTGKTSAARILAKIINCESTSLKLRGPGLVNPCEECEQCVSITKGNNLDVVEMDAASHRGIDDMRALRDAVKLAPTKSKKKIYIIDEAHMLTPEACNALLKTLEEPPEHVIFILATTNPEKLIDTIRSRTTLIAFRKAGVPEIVKSLNRVADAEKIKISEEALLTIANASGGAFRDAIKILEQFSLEGEDYLNNYKSSELSTFLKALVEKDVKTAINEIEKNSTLGISMSVFLKELLETFHLALLADVGINEAKVEGFDRDDLVELGELFMVAVAQLEDSPIEQIPVELAVLKWCEGDKNIENRILNIEEDKTEKGDMPPETLEKKAEAPPGHRPYGPVAAPAEELKIDDRGEKIDKEIQTSNISNQVSIQSSDFKHQDSSVHIVNDGIWQDILKAVRPINASIEGLLRSSRPVNYDGKTLTLGVFYKFHKERLEDTRHRKILEDVLEKVLNSPTRIACTLVDPPAKTIIQEAKIEPVLTETKDQDIIKIAEDIFSN